MKPSVDGLPSDDGFAPPLQLTEFQRIVEELFKKAIDVVRRSHQSRLKLVKALACESEVDDIRNTEVGQDHRMYGRIGIAEKVY
jgi:transcription antitermination factor NusA-like protein